MKTEMQNLALAEENISNLPRERSKPMKRIKQISVTGLFGVLDHVIPLNMGERVTILHGSNGVGKTIILQLLNALFNQRNGDLRKVPFNEFRVDFHDESSLWVSKPFITARNSRDQSPTGLHFHFTEHGKTEQLYIYKPADAYRQIADDPFTLESIEYFIPGLVRMERRKWFNAFTGDIFSLEEILENFEERLSFRPDSVPEWLKELLRSVSIRFIETQRLLSPTTYKRAENGQRQVLMGPTVNKYAQEMAEAIKEKREASGTKGQELDETFPQRALALQKSMPEDELRRRLSEQEQKRSRFMAAGILDQSKSRTFQIGDPIEESQKKWLSVYVEDVDQKLAIFDELFKKIDLLNKIINKKDFLYKHMTINKDDGFLFTAEDDKEVPLNKLSSGEQHELVLLYDLLFKTPPGSLLLLDEPEASLHIVWQKEFLQDIQEVIALTDLDILIATHAPSLIHDRWDLVVSLKGKSA